MQTKTIKQSVLFKSTPHEIYEMLMDPKKHSEFTGDKAKISRRVGGKFSVFGGYATGENLELVPDKKIVQTWRASDWPSGHFSEVAFELEKSKTGAKLKFTQTRVPEDHCDDIKQGWVDYYWKPMKEMLGE
jgi:activator of HSP90 ATPase